MLVLLMPICDRLRYPGAVASVREIREIRRQEGYRLRPPHDAEVFNLLRLALDERYVEGLVEGEDLSHSEWEEGKGRWASKSSRRGAKSYR